MFSLTLLLHKPIIIRPLKNLFLPFFFPEKKVIQDFYFYFFWRWLEIILLLTPQPPQLEPSQTHTHPAWWKVPSCLQGQYKISNLNVHKVKRLTNYRYKLIRKLGNYNLRQRN